MQIILQDSLTEFGLGESVALRVEIPIGEVLGFSAILSCPHVAKWAHGVPC